jgi:hypothetical protein
LGGKLEIGDLFNKVSLVYNDLQDVKQHMVTFGAVDNEIIYKLTEAIGKF